MNRFVRAFFGLFCLVCVGTDTGAFSGNLSNAIFVDSVTGSDGYPGTMAQPKATISGALSIATSGKNIYVSKGTYSEAVQMASGVSLYGQYDQASNWTPDPANTTIINGSANPVTVANVNGETHFEGFQVQAANAAFTQSSYAVRVDSSTGPIFIRYNTLTAGTGGTGQPGMSATAAPAAGNGGNGSSGSCDSNAGGFGGPSGISTCAVAGGSGGPGGYGTNAGTPGQNGSGGALAGFGGSSGNPGSRGGDGSPGTNGTNGANAVSSPAAVGSIGAGLYMPVTAPPGGSGTNGKSGSGGGGGGGQDNFFVIDGTGNGGGGGGAGGCGAGGGTSGAGGGGSFALFVSGSVVTVEANYLVVSQAGMGGSGGNGANGGTGGGAGMGGAICINEVGGGGNGGSGGKGGNSGAGAGGAGGPAITIFGTAPGSVTIGTNRYSLPGTAASAGSGGTSGSGTAQSGLTGVVRHGYPGDFADPGPATLAIADASILMPYTGSNFINVPVSLGPITNTYVTVHYQTVDGTAVAGTNYTAATGDLLFAPWATSQTIRVQVLGISSPFKTFSLQLSAPTNAGLTTSSDTVTINYDSDVIFRNGFD